MWIMTYESFVGFKVRIHESLRKWTGGIREGCFLVCYFFIGGFNIAFVLFLTKPIDHFFGIHNFREVFCFLLTSGAHLRIYFRNKIQQYITK